MKIPQIDPRVQLTAFELIETEIKGKKPATHFKLMRIYENGMRREEMKIK